MLNGKIWILSLFTMLFLTACNEQEFYDKEFLEAAVEKTPDIDETGLPTDELPDNDGRSGGDNDGSGDNNNGGSGDNNNGGSGDNNNGGSGDNNNGGSGDNNNGGSGDNNNGGSGDNNNGGSGDNNNGGSGDNNNGGSGDNNNGGSGDNNNGGSGDNNTGSNDNNSNNNVCTVGNPTDTQDQFVQNSATNSKVDILWVIDDSGSMRDNQQALADNFDTFIEGFINEGIDFKMGITTTDPRPGRSGVMVGDSDLLTSDAAAADEAQFKQNFKDWIRVGTSGSGNEQGLYSSRDFLNNYNDFLRDDAYLVVVYVSDEEDHSNDSVQEYLDFYQGLKASAGMFKAYSIVTTDASIAQAQSTESIGERYMAISTATSGEIADITQNFHTTLTNFSTSILNLLDSFPLSAEPINAEIQITVDGVAITSGWSYVADNRTIKFDQNAIPNAGEIVIAYYQKCE